MWHNCSNSRKNLAALRALSDRQGASTQMSSWSSGRTGCASWHATRFTIKILSLPQGSVSLLQQQADSQICLGCLRGAHARTHRQRESVCIHFQPLKSLITKQTCRLIVSAVTLHFMRSKHNMPPLPPSPEEACLIPFSSCGIFSPAVPVDRQNGAPPAVVAHVARLLVFSARACFQCVLKTVTPAENPTLSVCYCDLTPVLKTVNTGSLGKPKGTIGGV